MIDCDIAILGAGPYGLAAAAHLQQVKGLDVRIFGEPMSFWDATCPSACFFAPIGPRPKSRIPICVDLEAYRRPAVMSSFGRSRSITLFTMDNGINARRCLISISGRLLG